MDYPISYVHYSHKHGVHADYYGMEKLHIPYEGQTTLPVFNIGGTPSLENEQALKDLGGTLRWDLRTRE
jgi:hypothetical protein